jgi:predicted amidohydrolase
VCAPDGEVLARAHRGTDEVLLVDIDLASAASSHARQLFMKHRRPELYGAWLAR